MGIFIRRWKRGSRGGASAGPGLDIFRLVLYENKRGTLTTFGRENEQHDTVWQNTTESELNYDMTLRCIEATGFSVGRVQK